MFVIARLDDCACKGFGRLATNDIMHSLNISPTLPRGEKPRQSIGKSVLEGGYYNAPCTARHTLHITENERCSNAVRLSSSTACDNNGGVCADKLGKALRFVKVYLLVWLRHFAVYNEGTLQISRATYREKKTSI